MTSATMLPAARPLPSMPPGSKKSNVWYDADGVLREHSIELPVDDATKKINAKLFACVVATCSTAEWVKEPAKGPANPFCPADGQPLAFLPLDATQDDPISAGRQRQLGWLARIVADKRAAAADALRDRAAAEAARAAALREAATHGIAELAEEMKGHRPSIAATAAVAAGSVFVVDLVGVTGGAALSVAMLSWGALVGYWMAVQAENLRRRLRKERLNSRAAKKARLAGRYAARAVAGTGAFVGALSLIEGLTGLDAASWWQTPLLSLLGLGLAWLVNREHWERLWTARRDLRREAAETAATAAAEQAARLEREARQRAEEALLRERLADIGGGDENDPLFQGELMKLEWERISGLETASNGFPQITGTWIRPDLTREVKMLNEKTKQEERIGWEFRGECKPGALISRGSMQTPLAAAKEWLVSVLHQGEHDASTVALLDKPDGKANTFAIMITERAPLGEAVLWRGRDGIRIEPDGKRYGHFGKTLQGDAIDELLYAPGRPFGGLVTGVTGGGKGVHLMRYLLNCLLAGIVPVLFDPKKLVDYADFVGIFPIGFSKRHLRIILTSLHLERKRREAELARSPKMNKFGAMVAGESRWQCRGEDGSIGPFGEPIIGVIDEFHDVRSDQVALESITTQARFQRASAMGWKLATQGGGLEDLGKGILREQVALTTVTSYRSSPLQARMAGQHNPTYSTQDLPDIPGTCLRQAPEAPQVPSRAAFVNRDPEADDTVYTQLWGKKATPELQIDDPMNWISDATKELWEQTGLMDLWRMARGEGGLDRLLADIAEDDDEEETAAVPGAPTPPAIGAAKSAKAPASGATMIAPDVILAILHEQPGLSRSEIYAHSAWLRAPGSRGFPVPSTISRAAGRLDPTENGRVPLSEGQRKLIDRGPKAKSWTLMPEALERAARCAERLAPMTPEIAAKAKTQSFSVAALLEQEEMARAEERQMIREDLDAGQLPS